MREAMKATSSFTSIASFAFQLGINRPLINHRLTMSVRRCRRRRSGLRDPQPLRPPHPRLLRGWMQWFGSCRSSDGHS